MVTSRRYFLEGMSALGLLAVLRPLAHGVLTKTPFPELEVSGSPGAIGLTHGRAFAKQIKHNLGLSG